MAACLCALGYKMRDGLMICVVQLHGGWKVGFGIDFWLISVDLREDS